MLVGFSGPGGVVGEGGAAFGVSESSGDGADVDTGSDEFSSGVVVEFVEGGVDAEPVDHAPVLAVQRVGGAGCSSVDAW